MGGQGGIGGNGLDVTVRSDAAITTQGSKSHGILAQSIGGGGGNGGFAISGAVAIDSVGVSVAVGGKGNAGGNASTVNVESTGPITTAGAEANGIMAQSIGGGGGDGGLSIAGTISSGNGSLAASIGGNGGRGGTSAQVTVLNSDTVTTTGDQAAGIVAQSIGGSGGNGGLSIAGTLNATTGKSLNVSFSLGGAGATGGNAGPVTVTNNSAITTGNKADPGDNDDPTDNAHGILAQSVGGGGGNGGLSGAFTLGVQGETTNVNLSAAVGGKGGSAGTGGAVYVNNTGGGAITTYSSQSHGIMAQSVGGSGGNGGLSVDQTVQALASGSSSTVNLSLAVGGKGGSGSTGGNAQIDNAAGIDTWGDASHGLFASSVGGSGGSGGTVVTSAFNCKASVCQLDPSAPKPTSAYNYNLQVGIGGGGGTGSNGGTATVNSSGAIHTRGNGSYGIYAYSIGGGGGDGGDASGAAGVPLTDRTDFYKSVSVRVGGTSGSTGNGGTVNVTHSTAAITTDGINSAGIFAQSVGGGGGRGGTGAAGFVGGISVGGSGGSSGNGGAVTVRLLNGGSHHDQRAGGAVRRAAGQRLLRHLRAERGRRWRRGRRCQSRHHPGGTGLVQHRCGRGLPQPGRIGRRWRARERRGGRERQHRGQQRRRRPGPERGRRRRPQRDGRLRRERPDDGRQLLCRRYRRQRLGRRGPGDPDRRHHLDHRRRCARHLRPEHRRQAGQHPCGHGRERHRQRQRHRQGDRCGCQRHHGAERGPGRQRHRQDHGRRPVPWSRAAPATAARSLSSTATPTTPSSTAARWAHPLA